MSLADHRASPTDATAPMPFDELERAYERLALAIDQAGREHEALFLTRLALVLAHRVGSFDVFNQSVDTALDDLVPPVA